MLIFWIRHIFSMSVLCHLRNSRQEIPHIMRSSAQKKKEVLSRMIRITEPLYGRMRRLQRNRWEVWFLTWISWKFQMKKRSFWQTKKVRKKRQKFYSGRVSRSLQSRWEAMEHICTAKKAVYIFRDLWAKRWTPMGQEIPSGEDFYTVSAKPERDRKHLPWMNWKSMYGLATRWQAFV